MGERYVLYIVTIVPSVCVRVREVYRYEGWFNQCPRLSGTIISAFVATHSLAHSHLLARVRVNISDVCVGARVL